MIWPNPFPDRRFADLDGGIGVLERRLTLALEELMSGMREAQDFCFWKKWFYDYNFGRTWPPLFKGQGRFWLAGF